MLLGALLAPYQPAAGAEGDEEPLAGWVLDVSVTETRVEPDVRSVRTSRFYDTDVHSMDLRWNGQYEYFSTPGCPSNNQTVTASGGGTGYFAPSFGFPSDWQGLPDPRTVFPSAGPGDYYGLQPNYLGQLTGTVTTSYCMGDSTSGEYSGPPVTEVILLPGRLSDLVDSPIGTHFEYTYSKTVGTTEFEVTVWAVKGDSQQPECDTYRHDVNSGVEINGSHLASFDSSVIFEYCLPDPLSNQPNPTVEYLSSTSNPGLDPGVLTFLLESLGFSIDYRTNIDEEFEPPEPDISFVGPATAPLHVRTRPSAIDVCFDFLTLLDRLGGRRTLDAAVEKLTRKVARLDPTSALTPRRLERLSDSWDKQMSKFLDQLPEQLDTTLAPLPDGLRESVSNSVMSQVEEFVAELDGYVKNFLGSDLGSLALDELISAIETTISDYTTACFALWEPEARHTIDPTSINAPSASVVMDGFVNPFLLLTHDDHLSKL